MIIYSDKSDGGSVHGNLKNTSQCNTDMGSTGAKTNSHQNNNKPGVTFNTHKNETQSTALSAQSFQNNTKSTAVTAKIFQNNTKSTKVTANTSQNRYILHIRENVVGGCVLMVNIR